MLVYFACLVQVASVPALFVGRFATWGALALTATTLGAMGVHIRIGSPATATPALLYTAAQLWLAWYTRRSSKAAV